MKLQEREGKNHMKAIDVANIFIELANDDEQGNITNMAVNKLVYFAQGWSLALLNKPLFDDDILAWQYGPVEKQVYYTFKPCGRDLIEEPSENVDTENLNSDEIDLIMDVYNHYREYSSIGLMNLSHDEEGPWAKNYDMNVIGGTVIPKKEIQAYFKKLKPIKRFSDVCIPEESIDNSYLSLV